MQFHITTMTCGGCARSVTKTIHTVDATAKVEVDLSTQRVTITTTAPQDQIVTALTNAGFAPV